MKFHWVAGIALWTILSGPAMYGSGPAPAAKQKNASALKVVQIDSKTTIIRR